MSDESPSPYEQAQRALDAWHATHPMATLYDMKKAVETHLAQLRISLLAAHMDGRYVEERPACSHCGTTMVAHITTQTGGGEGR